MIDYDKEKSHVFCFMVALFSAVAILLIVYGCFITRAETMKNPISAVTPSVKIERVNSRTAPVRSIDEPEPIIEVAAFTSSTPEIEIFVDETEATYIAKTIWGEARGCSKMEQAAVAWCILNRVDCDLAYIPNDIKGVVTQKDQFHGYDKDFPVDEDIYNLAVDVIERWQREKLGEENVGRVLPKEYLFFYGDGKHNHYTKEWRGGETWDWSLENPYD